jgi:hypothetical protein
VCVCETKWHLLFEFMSPMKCQWKCQGAQHSKATCVPELSALFSEWKDSHLAKGDDQVPEGWDMG